MDRIFRPGFQAVAIKEQDIDAIIAMKDPKAALVYLCVVRFENSTNESIAKATGLDIFSVQKAVAALCAAGLLSAETVDSGESGGEDIAASMEDRVFAAMAQEIEKLFGYAFSGEDLAALMRIYKVKGLPAEVILQLAQFYKADTRRRHGPGRRLRMSTMEKLAAFWEERGIDTLEKAEEYIKRQESYQTAEGDIKRILQIYGRELVASEKQYVSSWLDMGFSPDAIKLAYDRTIERIHEMNFRYMDKIIINWHEKGLHTPGEIEKGDGVKGGGRRSRGKTEQGKKESGVPPEGEMERLLSMLEHMGGE